MRYSKWLVKLTVVLMFATALLVPADRSSCDDGFYVVGGGAPGSAMATISTIRPAMLALAQIAPVFPYI